MQALSTHFQGKLNGGGSIYSLRKHILSVIGETNIPALSVVKHASVLCRLISNLLDAICSFCDKSSPSITGSHVKCVLLIIT